MSFFVTGVTGNVGSSILRRLLRDPSAQIWVLIRGDADAEIERRLHSLFSLWGLSEPQSIDASSRLHPVRGDMGQPKFGLRASDWTEVVANCDYLIHAAGVVRMNLPLEQARQHAVGSARNMIELSEAVAARGREVNLAFISTVGVAGKSQKPLIDDWATDPREFHNTYEQSKAEAEELLRAWQRPTNIRLTVHRPSMVVGASDGEILRHQIFFYLCEFLSGRQTRGVLPRLHDAHLDTVPVDYIADAVCWAVQHPESNGRIFNLCSGSEHDISLVAIQNWTRQALRKNGETLPAIRALPAPFFLFFVRAAGVVASQGVKRRLGVLPIFIDYLSSPQVFEGLESRRYLSERAGVVLPEPERYLPSIIRSFYH